MLKYPNGGFHWLMILAMAVEGWAIGHVLPYVDSRPHGIAFSLIFTLVFFAGFVTSAYYLAKGMAWLLYKVFPRQP